MILKLFLIQKKYTGKLFIFNRKKVKDWCESEGAPSAYDDLLKRLAKAKS